MVLQELVLNRSLQRIDLKRPRYQPWPFFILIADSSLESLARSDREGSCCNAWVYRLWRVFLWEGPLCTFSASVSISEGHQKGLGSLRCFGGGSGVSRGHFGWRMDISVLSGHWSHGPRNLDGAEFVAPGLTFN